MRTRWMSEDLRTTSARSIVDDDEDVYLRPEFEKLSVGQQQYGNLSCYVAVDCELRG